ncbi:hypothetical protein LY76DRAFT_652973, partial [Colletotrichum caudatum]
LLASAISETYLCIRSVFAYHSSHLPLFNTLCAFIQGFLCKHRKLTTSSPTCCPSLARY